MTDAWSITSLLTCTQGLGNENVFFFLPDSIEKTLEHVLIYNSD